MNKILKLAASIFLVVALCFSFTAENVVSAAKDTKATQESKKAMKLFRESLFATVEDDKQIFHQFFLFLMPDFQGELEFNGKIDGHTLGIAGNLGIWFMGINGKADTTEIPFYLRQNQGNMEFYYKTDDNWTKYTAPTIAANVADIVTSPTRDELEKQIAMVKEVKVLQDNDSRRILLVHLDSAKLADEFKAEVEKNPANKGTAEDSKFQQRFLSYIEEGIRNSDLWYTWKIDKKNNRTGAISFDLSQIIQETALVILNDPKNKDLPDPIKEILENLAFYSEFKAYTTLLGPEAETSLVVPQEIIDIAKPAQDLVSNEKIEEKTGVNVEVTETAENK